MNFNKNKYKKCIDYLISLKTCAVIGYIILFAVAGAIIGFPISQEFFNEELYVVGIAAGIGAVLGLFIGLFSTYGIEMKIQEANWRIDVLDELKTQSSIATKNTPVAKTVVAIENKQNPTEQKAE